MRITGIVLAGGQGRRMGGADKGLVDFLGKPMAVHVIERLKPQVSELFINANREIDRYAALGVALNLQLTVIQDEIVGFAGPLAGLHRGMKAASEAYILTVPCDSPLLPHDLATRLMDALIERDADIAIAKTGGQLQPVFCLCRKTLLPSLEAYLNQGGRKMDAWQQTLEVAEVQFANAEAFSNVNTAEDLSKLEHAA